MPPQASLRGRFRQDFARVPRGYLVLPLLLWAGAIVVVVAFAGDVPASTAQTITAPPSGTSAGGA